MCFQKKIKLRAKPRQMQLFQQTHKTLIELKEMLDKISDEQFVQPAYYLSNSTIGQHVRHTVELFQCLLNGYETGIVNYDQRKRDPHIETSKSFAEKLLFEIAEGLNKPDKAITLVADYSEEGEASHQISSNYYRELAYNLEHTIHHMALVRVGLMEVNAAVVSDEFGVASSTIRYRKECAQ
jgi:hypothetical protein